MNRKNLFQLGQVILHEGRLMAADRAILGLLVLMALLVGYSFYNGVAAVRSQQKSIANMHQDEDRRLAKLKAERLVLVNDPAADISKAVSASPARVGMSEGTRFATKPPAPLAALAVGETDLYPISVRLATRSLNTASENDTLENPTLLLAGHFDTAFLLAFLLPLLIFGLTHNLISGEREQGTWAMVLSQPVAPALVVLGKVLARGGGLLALTFFLGVAGVGWAGMNITSDGTFSSLLLWGGVLTAYSVFWFGLAVVVNAFSSSSSANAVILTTLWLLLAVFVPSMVQATASVSRPAPSWAKFIGEMREIGERTRQEKDHLLQDARRANPALEPKQDAPFLEDYRVPLAAYLVEFDRRMEPVIQDFEEQRRAQKNFLEAGLAFSPVLLVSNVFSELAGAGVARHERFLDQVRAAHGGWREFFIPRIYSAAALHLEDYDRIPGRFHFQEEQARAVIGRMMRSIAWMSFYASLALAAAVWAVRSQKGRL